MRRLNPMEHQIVAATIALEMHNGAPLKAAKVTALLTLNDLGWGDEDATFAIKTALEAQR